MTNEAKSKEKVENVRVFIRIRPRNEMEIKQSLPPIADVSEKQTLLRLQKTGLKEYKQFRFSKIFDQESSQLEVFHQVAVPIVEKVFSGYNGTIFAYGQSGSGKTHTMIGPMNRNPDYWGIVPKVFSLIYSEISRASKDLSYLVRATFLEIYNEEVRDLLSDNPFKKLAVRERSDLGVYVKDLLGFTVDSMEGALHLLNKGNKNRATESTRLNRTSSRSHAIFTVLIESKNHSNNETVFGKLNLVDLAGSERVNKTLASGDRLKEAGKINLSLSVLGNVISALVDGKSSHVPYRNSKLTRLLQDSLGGNSMTSMIAMISPTELDYDESLCTLMYADRVKNIQNRITVNAKNKESIIESFEYKIQDLRNQLALLAQPTKNKPRSSGSSSKDLTEDLQKVEEERNELLKKIETIQKKILIGGENLLDKALEQKILLSHREKEIELLDTSHKELQETLENKNKEEISVSRQYSSLQEEDRQISREIERVEEEIRKATKLLHKKEEEYQNEIGNLLYTNKCLAKELGFVNLIISNSLSKECLEKILPHVKFDPNLNDWKLDFFAKVGNNVGTPKRFIRKLQRE